MQLRGLRTGFIAIPILFISSQCQNVVDLSQSSWTVSNTALNISVPGRFPSQAHLDLYGAGKIGDPYHGLNDFSLRWVAWSNWTYTSAPLTSLDKSSASTWLLFQGLDTFTSIGFCGEHVGSTNNQFRQYHFDVTRLLRSCPEDPVLSINFGSAPNIVDEIANEPGQEQWPFGVEQQFEFGNRQFMRKEQSDFGWDWGPAFAPAGPWLPAYCIQLEHSTVYVRNVLIDVYRHGQRNNRIPDQEKPWVVNASIDYIGELPESSSLGYVLKNSSNIIIHKGELQNVNATLGSITGDVEIPDGSVNLWWPTGLGPQSLYHITIDIVSDDVRLGSTQRRIGFRTTVLNQDEVTGEQIDKGIAPGTNWHFEINGHPFFAKGSNLIPPDTFWPRVTVDKMRALFNSVISGRQNMLRVWSSGAYLPGFMYDLADEMGILLWSEFEFSDSLYPVDSEFLDNVFEEAKYQVRRINHHPSLAFWAGGNEMENLELSLLNQSAPDEYVRYKDEYEKLFLSTLFPAVFENSRSISYAPSSTSNGFISLNSGKAPYFQERYESLAEGSIYGETDYYKYDTSVAFDWHEYPVGRFSNEFGFHSMPSIQTWRQAVSPRDLHFNSSVIQLRNHHYPSGSLNTSNFDNTTKGMAEMTMGVERWYPVPNKTDPTANFSAWCHATQIFQAEYCGAQIQKLQFYRRGSGQPQRTLGALYWQLNDIWQAPTWSSIEYDGRWKMLHYTAKDLYSNIIISPFFNESTNELETYVTSDLWDDVVDAKVSAQWYDWSGEKLSVPGFETHLAVDVGALNSTCVHSTNLTSAFALFGANNMVLSLSVDAKGRLPNDEGVSRVFRHRNWFHASRLSTTNLQDPGLVLDYDASSRQFNVEATKAVAAWVWLDYPAGAVVAFEANGFYLAKGERRSIGYEVKNDDTGGRWLDGVTVQSLWDQTLTD
ncbi:MAG: hypothetical protein M1831_001405 [Alyxoria varia]|nr:MAG: hypothetical protein M1831_001405 [Alyxoria varia]